MGSITLIAYVNSHCSLRQPYLIIPAGKSSVFKLIIIIKK